MVKSIMKDVMFLNQPSQKATEADKQVITDLIDTLRANQAACVGMAANMIGVKNEKPFQAEEGCLSLNGTRMTTRYDKIEVEYLDTNFKPRRDAYHGWIAQIIQHEVDHCDGILI